MTDRKTLGDRGEAEAAAYLKRRGFAILARQWRCRYGELDIVARDPAGVLRFVEVKLRSSGAIAPPRTAVDRRKQAKLRAAAEAYLDTHDPDAPACFDVAEVYAESGGVLRVAYWEDAFS